MVHEECVTVNFGVQSQQQRKKTFSVSRILQPEVSYIIMIIHSQRMSAAYMKIPFKIHLQSASSATLSWGNLIDSLKG